MNRTAALLAGALAVTAVTAPAAVAGPKKKSKPKPITKTYTATAPNPDPTNLAGGYSVCAQNVPGSFHTEAFKVPAAGTLQVALTNYQGDWDLLLMDGAKEEIAFSGNFEPGSPEVVSVKFKKAQPVSIVACNWAGGPTGQVKYTFTFK